MAARGLKSVSDLSPEERAARAAENACVPAKDLRAVATEIERLKARGADIDQLAAEVDLLKARLAALEAKAAETVRATRD